MLASEESQAAALDASAIEAGPADVFSHGLMRRLMLPMILAVLAYGALLFYADAGAIVRNARQVSAQALLLATVLASANYVVRFVRWQFYLRKLDIDVGFRASVLVFLSGFAMSVTPGKMGEVLKSLLLKESHSIPVVRSAPIILAERVTDVAGLLILGAIGLLSLPHGVLPGILALLGVGFLFALCLWRALGDTVIDRLTRVRRVAHLRGKLHAAYSSLLELTQPWPFGVGLALSVVAWSLQCVSLNVIAWAFPDVTLTLRQGLFAYSAPLLAGTLALIPGGLGLTEASMTGALRALGGPGMTRSVAVAVAILSRLSSFWLAIAIGFAALALWRAQRSKARPTRE